MVKQSPRVRTFLAIAAAFAAAIAIALLLPTAPARRPTRTAPAKRPTRTAPAHPSASGPTRILGGRWKLVFDGTFSGSSLNLGVWNAHNGWANQNGVTDSRSNVAVRNGEAILTLASPTSGAEISTRHFALKVGEYAQARIAFPGKGPTIYNWPAWWTSGPDWPTGGENDIAEGFGSLTVNYHSPTLTSLTGGVPGNWGGSFHTYGLYRGRHESKVYWDGHLVRTYPTADDGKPQTLLLTIGTSGLDPVTGPAGAMVVKWVRAWAPS